MAYGFDIVAIWIQHKGTEVVCVVMRPQPRLTIALTVMFKCQLIKPADGIAVGGSEGNMPRRMGRLGFNDPKHGFVVRSEGAHTLAGKLAVPLGHQFHHQGVRAGSHFKLNFYGWS